MAKKFNRKTLESELQRLESYPDPKVVLEQYHTPPDIASTVLHLIELSYHDIHGKNVLDLGCGCGILGIGCALLGAAKVVAVDIDEDALTMGQENADKIGLPLEKITFLRCDVKAITSLLLPGSMKIDTVITNPPFGTRKLGMDYVFVQKGLELANVVYSLHKSSTRDFWKESRKLGCDVQLVEEDLPFNIGRTFKFHKKNVHQVHVDLIRFSKSP